MQSIIFPLTLSTLAGLSTLIGAIFIFFKIQDKNLNKFISFCLAFSISVMITISILDLIPTSFFQISNIYGVGKSILILIIAFIISYIVITYLSVRIEKETHSADLYKLGILNMIVLILHNIPEGISIAVPIYYATKNRKKAIKATLLSGLSEPVGALLAFVFLKKYVSDIMISVVLIVVAGLMITLSIQEMLPKALKYKENKYIYLGLIIGTTLVIINVLIS